VRRVPDDHEPPEIEAERDKLRSQEGTVRVADVAANELASGQNDDGTRPSGRYVRDAFLIFFAVTSR